METQTAQIASAEDYAAMQRTVAAVRVVEAKRTAANAAAALAAAQERHQELCRRDGVTQTVTDEGDTVESLDKERRNFDAKAMSKLVTADVFDQITDRKVAAKKFDAAVELGVIDPKAVKSAIEITEYSSTKVYWAD